MGFGAAFLVAAGVTLTLPFLVDVICFCLMPRFLRVLASLAVTFPSLRALVSAFCFLAFVGVGVGRGVGVGVGRGEGAGDGLGALYFRCGVGPGDGLGDGFALALKTFLAGEGFE